MVKVLASYLANSALCACSTEDLLCGLGWITKGLIVKHLLVPSSQTQIFSTLAAVLLEPIHVVYHPHSLLLLSMYTTLSTCTTTATVQPQGNIYQIPQDTKHQEERCVERSCFYIPSIEKVGTLPTDVLCFTFFPAQFKPLTFLEIFLITTLQDIQK